MVGSDGDLLNIQFSIVNSQVPIETLSNFSFENSSISIIIQNDTIVEPEICPKHSFCPVNSSTPITCPPRTYTFDGQAETLENCSSECPLGMFKAFYTDGYCINCPVGMYNDLLKASTCFSCPDGTFANTTGNALCSTCPLGFFTTINTGYVNCKKACSAPAGQYCPDPVGTPKTCPTGYYCLGGTSSTACPVNTYNPNTGGSSLADCLYCPLFQVAPTTGQSQCQVCSAGTLYRAQNQGGPDYQGVCDSCPSGTSSTANATACTSCQLGEYSIPGASCGLCKPGTFTDVIGTSQCFTCPAGTYTYNATVSQSGQTTYTVLWGSKSVNDCIDLPNNAGQSLVCLPGKRLYQGSCIACPIGYYCPTISTTLDYENAIRVCPDGKYSATPGAISASDCTVSSPLPIYNFDQCSLSTDDVPALGGKTVTAMTSSLSRNLVYFTTATAVYRLYLVQSSTPNTLELVAGQEGTPGAATDAAGSYARFSDLTAIGVEHDVNEASIAVVGDGTNVRLINIYSKHVWLLGKSSSPLVAKVGGIAIRRDSSGARIAYVSDVLRHRIMGFNLENFESFLVAGDINGNSGRLNGLNMNARFWEPKGLAFLERSMNNSVTLLVADSKNNLIRSIDTSSNSRPVSTWLEPLDKTTPEISNPVSISVAPGTGIQSQQIYYVSMANKNVRAIQLPFPSDTNIKVVTPLSILSTVLAQSDFSVSGIFPVGSSTQENNNAVGYKQLLMFNAGTGKIKSLVQDLIVNTIQGGSASATCHLPCADLACASLTQGTLCGNSFLDSSEFCDNANRSGGGCDDTCNIRNGYTCPLPLTKCTDPCVGYNYTYEGKLYCSSDCKVKTPRPGYKINQYCVEEDIDECANELGTTNNCTVTSKCTNIPGSYVCACFNTFFGDGTTCLASAHVVYTVVDIPTLSRSSLDLTVDANNPVAITAKKTTLDAIKAAYANTLYANIPTQYKTGYSNPFSWSLLLLTQSYCFISLDPNTNNTARIEISTLFETPTLAAQAAASTTPAQLSAALSAAVFGAGQTTGVSVVQQLKTRSHKAASFSTASTIDSWGMNITSVNYNRTCVVEGVTPRGGCWQVEMIYVGGPSMPKSDLDPGAGIQTSKNVLYLPRIDKNPTDFSMLSSSQALTMTSGTFFPCDTSGSFASGITSAATACCLKSFNSTYRPHSKLKDFLASSAYNTNVPQSVCDSGIFTDSSPNSDVVFYDPENPNDASTNDLVVGKIDGMPNSEVRLLETIDYTTRTFRVLLVLEEGDLRLSASMVQGNIGVDYSMTFFVGLANFKGLGGSIMSTRNAQQFITVTKSNVLTMSTYGANQDPLISSVDMKFYRVKVTDFFQPVRYLYYLQPIFTMPSNYKAPDDGQIVPLNGIRVIKATGSISGNDAGWKQACLSSDGNYLWANTSLQSFVAKAQSQSCILNDLQMCYPPTASAQNLIQFGIPLPEDYISTSDFRTLDPYSLQISLIINAKDTASVTTVRTTLSLAVDLTPLSYIMQCETMKASQNLADIIQGNIYIGVASNSLEWDTTVLKKVNIDVPGKDFSNSFEFNTTTVQGAVMTFAALGESSYFDDPRNLGQYVQINDLQTVHFLEPLGGKKGPSPKFDAVKALLFQGKAYNPIIDEGNKSIWLEPSSDLLNLCPKRPIAGKLTCLTRVDSTFKSNVLTRDSKVVVEVVPNTTSVDQIKTMMANIFMNGGSSDYTTSLGTNFHTQLVTQLKLNARYRKAYVINPVVEWSSEAIQEASVGATSFTVCTKIIAIGMVTIYSAAGAPIARRLLSTELSNDWFSPFAKDHYSLLVNSPPTSHLLGEGGGRSLLQVSSPSNTQSNSLDPSKTQMSNSMQLNLDVPGYDEISQLCQIYNLAPYAKCNVFEIKVQIPGVNAVGACLKDREGSFITVLQDGFYNSFVAKNPASLIKDVNILNYDLQGCDNVLGVAGSDAALGRRLLAATTIPESTFVVVTHHVVLSSAQGSIYYDPNVLKYISDYFNSSIWSTLLGGGGSITYFTGEIVTVDGNKTVNINVYIRNATKPVNNSIIIDTIKDKIPHWNPSTDDMFITDSTLPPSPNSASFKTTNWWLPQIINALLIMTLVQIFVY